MSLEVFLYRYNYTMIMQIAKKLAKYADHLYYSYSGKLSLRLQQVIAISGLNVME